MKSINLDRIKKTYDAAGFVIVRNLFHKEFILSLKNNLEDNLSDITKNLKGRNISFTNNKKINSIHKLRPFKDSNLVRENNNLKKIVKKLVANKIVDFGSEVFLKPAINSLKAPPHQDNYYWCLENPNALTVWIALENANKRNGAVYYYEGTHKLGLLEHTTSNIPGLSQKLKYPLAMKKYKKHITKLSPGDCIFHHSLTVHGSEINKSSSSRIGLTLRYASGPKKFDKLRKKYYEKQLMSQIKSRKTS